MKWIERGIQFEGTVAEFKELHDDGMQPVRTRAGRTVFILDDELKTIQRFTTIKNAAEWISSTTGFYISPQKLVEYLDENGAVKLSVFECSATLRGGTGTENGMNGQDGGVCKRQDSADALGDSAALRGGTAQWDDTPNDELFDSAAQGAVSKCSATLEHETNTTERN